MSVDPTHAGRRRSRAGCGSRTHNARVRRPRKLRLIGRCSPDEGVVGFGAGTCDGVVVTGVGGAAPAVVAYPGWRPEGKVLTRDSGVVGLVERCAVVRAGRVSARIGGDQGTE